MLRGPLHIGLLAGTLVLSWASTGWAHPLVDRARRHMDAADFEAAVEVLEEAERADGLSRESLVELFEVRAMASHALHRREAMFEDMERLCALKPDHDLSRVFPPDMHAAWRRACSHRRRGLSLVASVLPVSGGVQVDVDVRHSAPGLVRSILVWARVGDDAAFRARPGSPARIQAPAGAPVHYFAQAIGPGGTVVAQLGTPDRPQRYTSPRRAGADASEPPPMPRAFEEPAPTRRDVLERPDRARPSDKKKSKRRVRRGVWWLVGSTGLALAAGGVAAALLVDGRGGSSTRVSAPSLPGGTP